MLSRGEFLACYDAGRKFFTRNFVLFVLDKPGQEGFRLGLTVSRKTGPAVARNRVRRVLREYFRLSQGRVAPHIDIVVVPKRGLDPGRVNMGMAKTEFDPVLDRLWRTRRDARPE